MKHLPAFIIMALFGCSFATYAQTTITIADFPVVGNLVVHAIDNTATINPGNPGQNQVWDFSALTAASYDSTLYLPPQAGIPAIGQYPEATMIAKHLNVIAPGDYDYDFMKPTAPGVLAVGVESLSTIWGSFNMALHVKYMPPSYILPLPFSYGSSSSQQFVVEYVYATHNGSQTLDSVKTVSHVTMQMLADASGNVITPDATFAAIRVKETLQSVDSTFSLSNNTWVYSSDTTGNWTQYRWYTNDYGEIAYLYSDTRGENEISFFKSETIVGTFSNTIKPVISVYPNPASRYLSISSRKNILHSEIFDLTGRAVLQAGAQTTLDIEALQPGTYVIKVWVTGGVNCLTFVKD